MPQLRRVALGLALLGFLGCYHVRSLFAPKRAEATAPALYAERCSTCHGPTGRGDGPAGQSLSPRPRDFASAAWQRATSNAHIRDTVHGGGGSVGLSVLMPAQPDLSEAQLGELVAYIRAVGARASQSAAAAAPSE